MLSVATAKTYPTIQEWEETGVLLCNTLSRYLELSISLRKNALAHGTRPAYLASRIESALESLHSTLEKQLTESRSVLAETRNMLISPTFRLPGEVLSQIFMHIVFSLDTPERRCVWSTRGRLLERYRAFHNILGVCKLWRNAALARGRGELWSLVPAFDCILNEPGFISALERNMDWSKGTNLTLAATWACFEARDIISSHAHRLRAVDIVVDFDHSFKYIVEMLTSQHGPECLAPAHLSLYRDYNNFDRLPDEEDYIFGTEPLNQIFRNLLMLQIRGGLLRWDVLATAEHLTTFHLQETMLGYDSALIQFLQALSSVTQLRELKLIEVKTYLDPAPLSELLLRSHVSLPNLESIIVKDLYFNTWRLLLLSIQSHSHRLSFVFTPKSLKSIENHEYIQEADIQAVYETFRSTFVHALSLHNTTWDSSCHVVSPGNLAMLLQSMPSLESLWMNNWYLSRRYCRALDRARKKHNDKLHSLVSMYFTCVELPSPESFESMMKGYSHSLRRVALGGRKFSNNEGFISFKVEEVAGWLKVNVPEFEVIGSSFEPPEFRNMTWQELW